MRGLISIYSIPPAAKRVALAGGTLTVATASAAIVLVAISAGSVAAEPKTPASQPSVPVTVDPATTAYLVLDDSSAVCAQNPRCVATLPAAANLLAKARVAGALVVFSKTVNPGDRVLPQLAPRGGEQTVSARADKFFGTELDHILRSHGIKTAVMVGTKTNGAILYTAFAANARGYTVVVATDGVSAGSDYIQRYSLFQLLNQPGFANPANAPLAPHGVTLSETDLITFRR
jgi:nicotinamidase-related amidase